MSEPADRHPASGDPPEHESDHHHPRGHRAHHGDHHSGHHHRHPRRHRWLWLLLLLSGWLVAGVVGVLLWWAWQDQADYYDTTGGVYEKFYSGSPDAEPRIAIIDVSGVIVDGYAIHDQLKRVQKDDRIVAVVLRVESPGGTVTGSDYIYHYLSELRESSELPLVVSMGSMATSGGYYVAMSVGDQEDVIFAEPTTITGSIGVVLPHYDISGLMNRFDIEDDSIRSHPNKQMLSMTRQMTSEQRDIIQREVDASFERFKRVVLQGRPRLRGGQNLTDSQGKLALIAKSGEQDLATGQVFSADEAVRFGLVDRIGFLEDAVDRAAELAGVTLDEVRVVRFAKPKPLIELPALIQDDRESSLLTLLTRPTTQQCWYLAGTAPPVVPLRYEFEAGD